MLSWRMHKLRTKYKPCAQVTYLVDEIVATCKDERSRRYYARVARRLPDHVLFEFLAEIRQDPTIRKRGAVFVAKVKRYDLAHPLDQGVRTSP